MNICEHCNGKGWTQQQDPNSEDESASIQVECESCYGTGKMLENFDDADSLYDDSAEIDEEDIPF